MATILKRCEKLCLLTIETEILRPKICVQNFIKIGPRFRSLSRSHTYYRTLFSVSQSTVRGHRSLIQYSLQQAWLMTVEFPSYYHRVYWVLWLLLEHQSKFFLSIKLIPTPTYPPSVIKKYKKGYLKRGVT